MIPDRILVRRSLFRRDPTPLEIAAAELIGAQVALLTAHDTHERAAVERRAAHERAAAELDMLRDRIARLRATIAELSAEAEGGQP